MKRLRERPLGHRVTRAPRGGPFDCRVTWRKAGSHADESWLLAHGERVGRWPSPQPGGPDTDCYRVRRDFWIWRADVGGICFTAEPNQLSVCPSGAISDESFRQFVSLEWLPLVYQVWGRQVLHASGAAHRSSERLVAFTGPSGAGKSTLAYGLGRLPGWRHLFDDTLAFVIDRGRKVQVLPIPNEVRLRSASAEYYGQNPYSGEPLEWSGPPVGWTHIYFLEPQDDSSQGASITSAPRTSAYGRLLEQAYALSVTVPEFNRRLMLDYLNLTRSVSAFVLTYSRSFDALAGVLRVIERHVLASDSAPRLQQPANLTRSLDTGPVPSPVS